jgi:hypothetical protein
MIESLTPFEAWIIGIFAVGVMSALGILSAWLRCDSPED